jgi:hypothetical protein
MDKSLFKVRPADNPIISFYNNAIEQNFFESQPTQNVGVFILRNITHNWSTDRNREILSQFRQAAQPKTRVVIIDHIVPHAGAFTEMHGANIPGARGYEPPVPLLASAGSEIAFAMDILVTHRLIIQLSSHLMIDARYLQCAGTHPRELRGNGARYWVECGAHLPWCTTWRSLSNCACPWHFTVPTCMQMTGCCYTPEIWLMHDGGKQLSECREWTPQLQ